MYMTLPVQAGAQNQSYVSKRGKETTPIFLASPNFEINQSINQWNLYSALIKNKICTKALHKKAQTI